MKTLFLTLVLTLAVSASLLAGSVSAQTASTGNDVDLSTLSDDQLDSLVAILSGLPRQ